MRTVELSILVTRTANDKSVDKPMATPPSPPPPPSPSPEAASQSPSTLKRTRKATRLRSLATRPPGADRPVVVHVDPATGKADGPHKKKLRTYLGIVAHDKVDVTYENWKLVLTAQKDLIWEDIQAKFDIPEASDRTKKKILQTVGEQWRQFKSDLTSKWVLAADKDNVNDTVCEKYDISKEKWAPVLLDPQRPLLGGCAEKGTGHPEAKHRPPRVVSWGSTEAVIHPLSPIRRHMKWKMTRTKKTGQMTSEATKEIVEKILSHFQLRIDSLEEQASQVSFVPHGRSGSPDCCHWATRTPWSYVCCWSRCDHQAILWIGSTNLLHFFLHGSQRTRAANSTNQGPTGGVDHRKSDLAADVILQLDPVSVSVTDSIIGTCTVSTKGSCVDPSMTNPDTGDSDKCRLYISENPPRCLVALGRVYEGYITIHNIPLLHDQVKVGVEEVKDVDAHIHVPTDEVNLVGQALNTFLAWPTHLVKHLSEQVMWDATVFGVFNQDFPLYINHKDLSEIAHGGQCLSIFVIQLWILHLTETSMRAGNSDNSKCNVYLGAYLNGAHWQMVVILPKENLVVWFCSLHNRPDNYLKGIINSALKGLDDTPQPKSKAGVRWIVVKYFNDVRPLEAERLKALHIQWA
ncbi:hypothetical protein HKD37_13G035656 [Glycine soja]